MQEPLFDRIKYDGPQDGSPWLIYKYPSEKVVLGSQLIVNQGQEVLFFKDGRVLDLFREGIYTLKNLPLLNRLVNLTLDGEISFSVEIYYVNKIFELNMNWSTPSSFSVEDPKYGITLSIRPYGTYGMRIRDTRMFIEGLVGVVPKDYIIKYEFITSYFNELLVLKVVNIITKYRLWERILFLEVTSYLDEILRDCEKAVNHEFRRFGIEIVNLYVKEIISQKDEYEKLEIYKKKLHSGIFQDINNYMNTIPNKGTLDIKPNGSNENICPHCRAVNPIGQKFCGECGAKLIKRCPSCGTENEPTQKFCGECGTKL